MIRKEIPQAEYAHIGGSGTWGDDFPENVGIEGVKILDSDMEFETPFGTTVPMKLFEIPAEITADHKKHVVLDMPFHGWFGLSPYLDTPSERVFWVLQRAGVKWILADGSGGGINPLLDPGDVIIPDDLIDQTKRVSYLSKFTDKIVRMRDIVCPDLAAILYNEALKEYPRVFGRGTYAVDEAPRFETKAEIQRLYDQHCDICGHTMMPEAALARAIGAHYAAIYIVSNCAEGIDPDWKRPIFDIYAECAPKFSRIMVRALAAIDPEKIGCHYGDNLLDVPSRVQKRMNAK